MMKHVDLLSLLTSERLLPVIVIDDAAHAAPAGHALLTGGLQLAEVTFRTPAAADSIEQMSSLPNLTVGAGTVIRAEQVDQAVAAGAKFVVTPGVSAEVIRRCQELQVPVVPGVATASDIIATLDLGIDVMKFFPAEASGGIPALRALSAPFPQVRFVPTGGISVTNAVDYLALDSVLAVGGSWMIPPTLLQTNEYRQIVALTQAANLLVRQ